MKLTLILTLFVLSLYTAANDQLSNTVDIDQTANTETNDQASDTVANDQPTNTIASEQPINTAVNNQPTNTIASEQPLNIDDQGDDQSLKYEPIAIDGKYTKKSSPAERMKRLRAKLEQRNELLVKRKIESLRLRQEMKMTRRLQKIFNQQMQALESIN